MCQTRSAVRSTQELPQTNMISHRSNQNKDRNGHLEFLASACICKLEVSAELLSTLPILLTIKLVKDLTSFLCAASCSFPAFSFLIGYHAFIVPCAASLTSISKMTQNLKKIQILFKPAQQTSSKSHGLKG